MKQTIRLNLTPTEANFLLHGLNKLRNKWLEEGWDTYLVDEVSLHLIKKLGTQGKGRPQGYFFHNHYIAIPGVEAAVGGGAP